MAVVAAASSTVRPTRVEPVNETMSTSGCRSSTAPQSAPVPVSTLTTPAGMPASVAISANSRLVSGVSSDGLSTIVFPAAIAGRIFHAPICSG